MRPSKRIHPAAPWLVALLVLVLTALSSCRGGTVHADPDEQIAIVNECKTRLDTLYKEYGTSSPKAEDTMADFTGWLTPYHYKFCHQTLDEGLMSNRKMKHDTVVEVMRRTKPLGHVDKLIASLDSTGLSTDDKKVASSLTELTGEDFGTDKVAWQAWRKKNP